MSEHAPVVITAKPTKNLEEKALTKTQVKVIAKNKHIIMLPIKVYNFYKFDENDYTVMTSDKTPQQS